MTTNETEYDFGDVLPLTTIVSTENDTIKLKRASIDGINYVVTKNPDNQERIISFRIFMKNGNTIQTTINAEYYNEDDVLITVPDIDILMFLDKYCEYLLQDY